MKSLDSCSEFPLNSPFRPLNRAGLVAGRALAVGLGVASWAVIAPAQAQEVTRPAKDEFSVQRFDPAPGPRNFFVTRTARSDGTKTGSAGLMLNYAHEPLVIVSCMSATECDEPNPDQGDIKVVENLFTGDLMGSFTLMPPLQFGLRVPITYVKGAGLDREDGGPQRDGLKGVAIGDPMLEGKYRFYGSPESPIAAAGGAFITAPLGHATAENKYVGDVLPTFGLRGIGDMKMGPWSAGANLVVLMRKSGRIGATHIGSELRYSVAGGYQVGPAVRVVLEGFGHTRMKTESDGSNGLEGILGAQVTPVGSPLTFSGGAGLGVIDGVGVPGARGFLGVLYTMERRDQDSDGLFDDEDSCPTETEDRDGYQDSDGCPDADNDDDRIPDSSDKCPSQAEDLDGHADLDGCPDGDNDEDGVADERDACPKEKETKNDFKDDDGCPDEVDVDLDGVPDARDGCPNEAEDTDGFKDEDGCPDPDNDNDGVLDANDECGDQAETVNEFEDEDGCPDEEEAKAAKKKK